MNRRLELFLLIIIFGFAIFVRFYNFEERITFGPEQGMFSSVAADYLKVKPSLLGHQYFRSTSSGHFLFHGAQFNYSLVPILLLTNYDPVGLTTFFPFLNVFSAFLMVWLFYKVIGFLPSIFAAIFFLFNSTMIYHSMFLWDLNYLPLLGVLLMFSIYRLYKTKKVIHVFYLGLLGGIGIGLDYGYAPTLLLTLLTSLIFYRNLLQVILVFSLGFIVGDFPMILFDIKHNFYHINTVFSYVFNAAKSNSVPISYYHFLQFWPFLAIIFGVIFNYLIFKKSRLIAFLIISFYILINLSSPTISFVKPVGMPEKTTVNLFQEVARIIADDKPENFNLVTLLDFDTRSYPLRYILTYVHHAKPLGVEQYNEAKTLYVFAKKDYPIKDPQVWELKTFLPYKVAVLSNIDQDFVIYKLTK